MILFDALDFIQKQLNAFLDVDAGGEPKAVLSSIVAQDGTVPPDSQNRVVLSLINVEREGAASPAEFYTRSNDGNVERVTPPLNLNLYLLVTVNHQDYAEALKLLSNSIAFFQVQPVFTATSAPGFPDGIRKLAFEVVNLQLQDMSHLWGALGAKYQPSIIYKVRMLTVQEAWVQERRPAVGGVDTSLSSPS